MFTKPMLAAPMPKTIPTFHAGEWVMEEKFDGHRLIVSVASDLPLKTVRAWSRNGLDRILPAHLVEQLRALPAGTYDGELLVPGKRSYGVTELVNGPDLCYYVFDVLELLGHDTTDLTWRQRRDALNVIFDAMELLHVRLSMVRKVNDMSDVQTFLESVWTRDGEGLILKRTASRYSIGKRPKGDWIKMKALRSAVCTVVGFEPGRGLINDRGPFAMVNLVDDDGNEVSVKTLNDVELEKFTEQAVGLMGRPITPHPAIGRKLRIEYQERTPDGCYRHPRWDRWENE